MSNLVLSCPVFRANRESEPGMAVHTVKLFSRETVFQGVGYFFCDVHDGETDEWALMSAKRFNKYVGDFCAPVS